MTEQQPGSGPLGDAQEQGETAAGNRRKWRVSRRRLLKIMGAAGLAGLTPVAFNLATRTVEAAGEPEGEPPTGRLRRWGMVIDLRRCDGCQSQGTPPKCTAACIQGHFVPQPMEWIQVFEYGMPGGGSQFVPVPCQCCQNPPCVAVCPVGATWSTPEGPVLIDQARCIGCRMCMAACPYDRRFFNWGQPPIPPEARLADYSPERQTPLRKGVTCKCDFCPDMARAGRLPYCAQGCPNDAIYYGDFEEDLATNGAEVVELSRFLSENQAYRLKEDLNTKPRVYYIPGYGQGVGRDPYEEGRMPSEWPWEDKVKGAKEWKRASR